MNFLDERPADAAAAHLRARILGVIPAGSYQLDRFFQLFDLEVTRSVPTAAVRMGATPRLRVNPDFVERHCRTDEALFVLVLHEMLHVVLGHTRLFARATPAHNLAFDAVINAMIARAHPEPAYLELLQEVNCWERFPARLLRPAPGWPQSPAPLPHDASDRERVLHASLYSSDHENVTYHELFELLAGLLGAGETEATQLLGGHDDGGGDEDVAGDPTVRDVIDSMVRQWPAQVGRLLRGAAGPKHVLELAAKMVADKALERALAAFFARAGLGRRRRLAGQPRTGNVPARSISVLPQAGDRRGHARAVALGRPPVFWDAPSSRRLRTRPPVPDAFVYLDVSGSMGSFLPFLRAALRRPVRDGVVRLFAFSTVIAEVDVRTFGQRATQSSGGTEINAVLQHVLSLPQKQRPPTVALVTDGQVGAPAEALVQQLRRLGIAVHVALTPGGCRRDLAAIAKEIVELPAPGKPASSGTAARGRA
jgi:hypothetical protein